MILGFGSRDQIEALLIGCSGIRTSSYFIMQFMWVCPKIGCLSAWLLIILVVNLSFGYTVQHMFKHTRCESQFIIHDNPIQARIVSKLSSISVVSCCFKTGASVLHQATSRAEAHALSVESSSISSARWDGLWAGKYPKIHHFSWVHPWHPCMSNHTKSQKITILSRYIIVTSWEMMNGPCSMAMLWITTGYRKP